MSELLNCPWCGSHDVTTECYTTEEHLFSEGCVSCNSCGAQGPMVSNLKVGGERSYFNVPSGDAMEQAAVNAWNNRSPLRMQAEIARLREELEELKQ